MAARPWIIAFIVEFYALRSVRYNTGLFKLVLGFNERRYYIQLTFLLVGTRLKFFRFANRAFSIWLALLAARCFLVEIQRDFTSTCAIYDPMQ
jgi:hypothetical protein